MRIILTSRKGRHYESARRGEATVLYVPGQEDPRVYRDLEGKSASEVAERYGAANKKPLIRQNQGEVEVYGTVNPDVAQRRHAVKVYLPQDFVPRDTHAFYYMLGKKYIVHGVRTITDEGEERWGNSLITLQGGDPVKIVTSAISERMLDGDAEGICVAVDGNLEVYEGLKDALKPFNIKVTPFSALKLARAVKPLYQHKDYGFMMILVALLMVLVAASAAFFWFVTQQKVDRINAQINKLRREIASIQNNEKLGHVMQPQAFLQAMSQPIKATPSSFLNAGAYVAREFGDLELLTVSLANSSNGMTRPATSLYPEEHEILTMVAQVEGDKNMLLVDQEVLARSLVASRSWLRKIENTSNANGSIALLIDMQTRLGGNQ